MYSTIEYCFLFCRLNRLIKALLEENIATMSEHMNHATDKIEFQLDNAIAEQNADNNAGNTDSK